MKQKLQTIMIALALTLGVGVFATAPVGAINVLDKACSGSDSEVCAAKSESVNSPVRALINTLLFAVGIISVVMIIVGGIRYTTSNGDSSKIKSAKDTILYAVVGLIVAMLAYSIVNFVVAQFN